MSQVWVRSYHSRCQSCKKNTSLSLLLICLPLGRSAITENSAPGPRRLFLTLTHNLHHRGAFLASTSAAFFAACLVLADLSSGHAFQTVAACLTKILLPRRGILTCPAAANLVGPASLSPSKIIAPTGFLLPSPPSVLANACHASMAIAVTDRGD
jgi:hypothetical protein